MSTVTPTIDSVADKVLEQTKDGDFLNSIYLQLQKLVQKIQLDMISAKKRSEGYCVNFIIPEKEVLQLFNDLEPGLTNQISLAFKHTWNIPANVIMANSPYYHILLFIVLLGARLNNDNLAKQALNLLNFRMYNGR
jgi:hypothetical protein